MDAVSNTQIIAMLLGVIISGVLLWVGGSVNKLNSNVAKLIERTDWHHDTIKTNATLIADHSQRIARLESGHYYGNYKRLEKTER